MLPIIVQHLPRDRERMGLRPVQMAGHLELTLSEYRALEAGQLHITKTSTNASSSCAGGQGDRVTAVDIAPALRDDLIRYLFATSADRARIFGELLELNPGMAELLMDLEADADLRARCEMDLLAES